MSTQQNRAGGPEWLFDGTLAETRQFNDSSVAKRPANESLIKHLAVARHAEDVKAGRPSLRRRRYSRGVTLVELMATLVIMATLYMGASTMLASVIPQQELAGQINGLICFMMRVREKAINHGHILICNAGSNCRHFRTSHGLIAVDDINNNHVRDSGEKVVDQFHLPESMRIYWRSFQNKPWLSFGPRGTTSYQNGHYLICLGGRGRLVKINVIGKFHYAGKPGPGKCQSPN